jgi:hypothetical protein
MIGLRSLAIFIPLLLSSCAVVGRYEWNALVAGESLELRADHTFTLHAWSDQVDLERPEPRITGTWERAGALTIITTVESAVGAPNLRIGSIQKWRKTFRGFIRVEGFEFSRSSREAND